MRQLLAVAQVLGLMAMMMSSTYLLPIVTALIYGDGTATAFAIALAVNFAVGCVTWLATRRFVAELRPRDGFLLVSLAWAGGAAFACVQATAAAVSSKQAWNRSALRWCGVLLALLVACGLAAWYSHVYLETDEDQDQNDAPGSAAQVTPAAFPIFIFAGPRPAKEGKEVSWKPVKRSS